MDSAKMESAITQKELRAITDLATYNGLSYNRLSYNGLSYHRLSTIALGSSTNNFDCFKV